VIAVMTSLAFGRHERRRWHITDIIALPLPVVPMAVMKEMHERAGKQQRIWQELPQVAHVPRKQIGGDKRRRSHRDHSQERARRGGSTSHR
jgi:hypothetical protein